MLEKTTLMLLLQYFLSFTRNQWGGYFSQENTPVKNLVATSMEVTFQVSSFTKNSLGNDQLDKNHDLIRFLAWIFCAGIDTSNALLGKMRRDDGRKNESQAFLLEPLLALTGSLTLTQSETVSSLHKCDIPRQLFLSNSKLGLPEAILWLSEPLDKIYSWQFLLSNYW